MEEIEDKVGISSSPAIQLTLNSVSPRSKIAL